MELDTLKQAISALERTLERTEDESFMALQDDITRNAIRAGVIQHFEFTYEMCWKLMQRKLIVHVNTKEAEHFRTRKELIRLAARKGLIPDPLPWFGYGDARNQTSHTYAEDKAQLVYDTAKHFLKSAKDFLTRLEQFND